MDNTNDSEDNWKADNESVMEVHNGSEDSETPEQQIVSASPNVPGLFRPMRQAKKMDEMALMTVNIMQARRNMGLKKK